MTQNHTNAMQGNDRNTKLNQDYQSANYDQNTDNQVAQSGTNKNKTGNEALGTEGSNPNFQKNESKKSGGQPRGDQGIPNRGVTHADNNKDKSI